MITDIRVDSSYRDSVFSYSNEFLASAEEPIEIPWENTAPQIALLERHATAKFVLFVKDTKALAQAADRLGQYCRLDVVTVQDGKLALIDRKNPQWREFVQKHGPIISRNVLLNLLSRILKAGGQPPLTLVVSDLLAGRIHVKDADMFIRVHKMRGL